MRDGDSLNTVCTSSNGISPKLLQIIFSCSDSFTTWGMAFIKQVRCPTHRTLRETFGARRPSSVFFVNRFRSADCQKIQLPPGGSQGGFCEFARDFIKRWVPTATPQPLRRQLSFALSSCTPFFEWLHLLNLSRALWCVSRGGSQGLHYFTQK